MMKISYICNRRIHHKEADVIVKNVKHQLLNLSDKHDFGSPDLRKWSGEFSRTWVGIVIVPDEKRR
jgi:hypothetical protein